MKKFNLLLSILFLCTLGVFAQTPQKMNYQAIVRNSSDMILANKNVGIQISILQGSTTGSTVYVETQNPTTNDNGLATIEIGTGNVVSGAFSSIDWANNTYCIKTEIDVTGGTNYTITGTSQLMSVPYALHSKTAEIFTGSITETDPLYNASVAKDITAADITNWNNKLSTEIDDSITNEIELPVGGTDGQVLKTDGMGNYAWVDQTSDTNTTVTDNLTSTSTTEALSANQGKVLKDLVDVNTAKTGITTAQATDIANNKTGVASNLTALGTKVDKVSGKALSANDFTDVLKTKLDGLSNTTVTDNLTSTSTTEALSANQGKVLKDLVDVNTAKTGITTAQATDIANNKTGVASNVTALGTKVDKVSGKALSANDFTDVLKTKLDGLSNTIVTDNLTSTSTSEALSANQGKVLKDLVDTKVNTTIVNDLTTGGTTDALSAEQGKTLENSKAAKTNVLELDNTTVFVPDADYEPATKKYVDDSNTNIVNDLTTGGTTDALSAEQGKTLEDTKLAKTLTDGSLFVGNATNEATAVALSGDATIANDGTLTIADDAVDGTDISLTGETAGDVMYYDGTNWVNLPKGSAGQVLAINDAGTAPIWKTMTSSGNNAKRIGEFVYAKSGKTEAEGYLAVNPGTIVNGLTKYPLWAAQYPEFISGNDIVFPADVAGMFLRNNGGNAAGEGFYQNYRTARPTDSNFVTDNKGSHTHNYGGSNDDTGDPGNYIITDSQQFNGWRSVNAAGDHTHSITSGGDVETNPINRAYQLYTIVDTY